jgi:GTP-binding protein
VASRRSLPTVAIVGRPNVGKSTLFNRLVGKRLALVDPEPGVTRDRREGEGSLSGSTFVAIDTAGLDEAAPESLAARMTAQTKAAVEEADVSLFLVDARAGVTPVDRHFADLLRTFGKPMVLVANKAEGSGAEAGLIEAFGLGLGEPVAISAEHGEGMADLAEALAPFLPDMKETDRAAAAAPLRVAVIGRPNTGKSTLINRILGQERLLTGPEAGITRDAIAVDWTSHGRTFRLFDTAGLRRKPRVSGKLEKLAVADALNAVRFAEVVIVTVDVEQPFEKQDLTIADLVEREGRAVVIALTKWDVVTERQAAFAALRAGAERLLPQLAGARLVPVSGVTGEGIDKLIRAVLDTYATWNKRVPTARLNRWLEAMIEKHPPPAVSGRPIRLRYLTQLKARPPTFVGFCSRPEKLPEAYRRYLVNGLRADFALPGVPIRLLLRKGENPFEGKPRKRR